MLAVWGVIGLTALFAYYASQLPPIDQLAIPKRPPNIAILASDGTLLANRGDTGGAAVHLSELPPYLPKAFVAIEDRRFYSHFGLDLLGISRAIVRDVTGVGGMQGGSTLTQQLAKNLFLTQERTLSRKIQEAILALWLERKYSKDQILELYLNRVYFGSGAYGVEAAAQKYFGKSAKMVNLSEAAVLAGLMKSPTRLAPNRNLAAANERAAQVHHRDGRAGPHHRGDGEARARRTRPNSCARRARARSITPPTTSWTCSTTRSARSTRTSSSPRRSTPRCRPRRERALTDELNAKGDKFGVEQGALVALDPDGAVKALVGGRNYADSQFNRAVAAKRQPGSAFKPFVYLAALERGLTPDTVREDAPISIKGWNPENYSREYFGPVTLTKALSLSLNTVAVRLGLEVGPKTVVRTAHRLGIASDLEPNASIALGTSEVTPIELVTAYAAFANGGIGVQPHVITARAHRQRQAALRAPQRQQRPRHRAAICGDDERDDGRDAADRHRAQGGAAGLAGRGQDGHQPGLARRVVRRLHQLSRHRRMARQRRRRADQEGSGGGLPVEIWSRFMQAAHQGVPPAGLPLGDWRAVEPAPAEPLASAPARRPRPGRGADDDQQGRRGGAEWAAAPGRPAERANSARADPGAEGSKFAEQAVRRRVRRRRGASTPPMAPTTLVSETARAGSCSAPAATTEACAQLEGTVGRGIPLSVLHGERRAGRLALRECPPSPAAGGRRGPRLPILPPEARRTRRRRRSPPAFARSEPR